MLFPQPVEGGAAEARVPDLDVTEQCITGNGFCWCSGVAECTYINMCFSQFKNVFAATEYVSFPQLNVSLSQLNMCYRTCLFPSMCLFPIYIWLFPIYTCAFTSLKYVSCKCVFATFCSNHSAKQRRRDFLHDCILSQTETSPSKARRSPCPH